MLLILSFARGFGLSAALIVAIGAQNAFVLRQGLRREHVGPVVLFCALADLLLMAAGVAGIGTLLREGPLLVPALTLGGAAFLAFYGIRALRHALAPGRLIATDGRGAPGLGATLRQAAAFTLLNPHVYLDTVLLVGTVGAAQPGARRLAFLLGAGAASASWFIALGYGARLFAPVFARPGSWRLLDALVAAIMLVLAAALLAHLRAGG